MIECNKCKLYGECDHQGAYQKDGKWCYEPKFRILVPYACRSDTALTRPIIEKLSKLEWINCWEIKLEPANFIENYQSVESFLRTYSIDLVYISGDRIEMYGACVAAFHNNVPICHYGSGITNTITTFDDINRHAITLHSDICLCEDFNSAYNTNGLLENIGKFEGGSSYDKITFQERNIHIVGNLYLEGLDDIDESLVPNEPYDLVLINPETLNKDPFEIYKKAEEITRKVYRKSFWIPSNPDQYDDLIGKINFDFENLPRSQFLGLLKNCQRYITNSSCAYYEASHFLPKEKIIQIGKRNKGRSTPTEWKQEYKTSDRIIEIIEKWWRNR